jgi:hypothetical protein
VVHGPKGLGGSARGPDLGGLFIITPLVPLLGTILGYIFGRQESQGVRPAPAPDLPVWPAWSHLGRAVRLAAVAALPVLAAAELDRA